MAYRARALAAVVTLLATAEVVAIELSPCDITADDGRQEVAAMCGTLSAPLDLDHPEGEHIDLFVAVVEALTEQPAPDPLVVIAGGPGDAATRFFATAENAFARILRSRDIVLVDQRGSGKSAPLACANLDDDHLLEHADVETVVAATLDCLPSLDHDPRFFTTSIAVDDLDRVRAALGYEQLNLYGISYGTRVAQHYLRRFPGRTRSVILDGVLPPDVALGTDVALSSQAALDALFDRCADDDGCRSAFPDLQSHFHTVLDRLAQAPVDLMFDHPRTGESTAFTVDRWTMVGVVRLLVYSPQTASLLPVLVEAAYAGDYRAIATQGLLLADSVDDLAVGLNFAVVCTEDFPFLGDVDLAAQAATYMGAAFVEVLRGVCEHWPRGTMDADFRVAVVSDAPVLIVSGEFDPITPPRYVRRAAARLTNAVEIVGRGQGHGMLVIGCVQRLMAEFVDTASPRSLDLACVDRIRPFPLFASRMGPAP